MREIKLKRLKKFDAFFYAYGDNEFNEYMPYSFLRQFVEENRDLDLLVNEAKETKKTYKALRTFEAFDYEFRVEIMREKNAVLPRILLQAEGAENKHIMAKIEFKDEKLTLADFIKEIKSLKWNFKGDKK